MENRLTVCMVGTGEYTTGYVHGNAADSDKAAGVVGIVLFDLRSRGKVGELSLVGTNGSKFDGIRKHMKAAIADKYPKHNFDLTCKTFPQDNAADPKAYTTAFEHHKPGDAVTIFVPDDLHFEIAMCAIQKGLHVLITKPAVKTLAHHKELVRAAKEKGVLVMIEVHKRFDPMYADAYDRIRSSLGPMSFMDAYMSQPKHQLETFKHWAGKSSDISYYLNSHHIDFCEWAVTNRSRPTRVTATASTGVATNDRKINTEDSITLVVQWQNHSDAEGALPTPSTATTVFTASWVAPKSDVHSQQRFFFMGHKGEVRVEQAHRGYSCATDEAGYQSCNPLFMKYTPSQGRFAGQLGYGYRSIEAFVDACNKINNKQATAADFDSELPTIGTTMFTTAILEAGRRSLDNNGRPFDIVFAEGSDEPLDIVPATF